MTTPTSSKSSAPSLTPGASALSVAQAQTNAMNANASAPVSSTPAPVAPTSGAGTPNPTKGSLADFVGQNGGNLKAGQDAFQASLRAGTSSINGNNQFVTTPEGGLRTVDRQNLIDNLNRKFNTDQITKFENRNSPVASTTDPYAGYKKVFGDVLGTNPKPTPYSAVDEYNAQRDKYGITDLESQINDLSAQERELQAQTRARVNDTMDEQIPMGVISGRVGEVERQQNERLDAIQRQKGYLVDSLNSKNSAIKMFMDFHKEDYTMANQRFTDQFNQSLQMMNLFRGMNQDSVSEADKVQDNNRAMYTTVFNGIASGAVNPDTFTPEMKAQMTSLELKAGLPPGFTEMVRNKNPKADIIAQNTTTDNDGRTMLNLVMRDQITGKITTQNIYTGQSKSTNPGLQTIADNALQVNDGEKGGECGKFVNDILQKNGGSRVFGDTLQSKISATNSSSPAVGSAIVMDFGVNPNGHVGIVTKVDGGKVWVKSSNMKGDGIVSTDSFNTNDPRIKGYYKPDAKASTANDKSGDATKKALFDDVVSYKTKIASADLSEADAVKYLKSQYGDYIKSQGYSDDQVNDIVKNMVKSSN